jgi:hypothetical protein
MPTVTAIKPVNYMDLDNRKALPHALPLQAWHDVTLVRDDLLPGGTKSRGLIAWLDRLRRDYSVRSVCYRSPPWGYAQVALAIACRRLDLDCHIVSSEWTNQTRAARNAHANVMIHVDRRLADVQMNELAKIVGSIELPLGLDHPGFRQALVDDLRAALPLVRRINRLWVAVGSGTLLRCLHEATEGKVKIIGVDVHVLPSSDKRILLAKQLCHEWRDHHKEFSEVSYCPIPSAMHYDSKLWDYHTEWKRGDLIWNVAG